MNEFFSVFIKILKILLNFEKLKSKKTKETNILIFTTKSFILKERIINNFFLIGGGVGQFLAFRTFIFRILNLKFIL